ncbi:hypothetical protein HDV06_006138 [Boothiomyces sp. JEL0866]|nr:hypothetical protein HDV06_006138 [Boothiomyces sp. JEL0866]
MNFKKPTKQLTLVFILICTPFVYFLLDNFEISFANSRQDRSEYNLSNITDLFWLDKVQDNITYTIKEIPFDSIRFAKKYKLGGNYRSFGGSLVKTTKGYLNFQTVFEYPRNCTRFENGVVEQQCKPHKSKSLLYADALNSRLDKTRFVYKEQEYPTLIQIQQFGSYGPRDPKAIVDPYGNILVSFSMFDIYDNLNMWVYNCSTKNLEKMKPEIHLEETNWIPYYDGSLNFIYSWDPIKHISKDSSFVNYTEYSRFKGATPLVKYKEYYVGIIQVQGDCKDLVTRPRLTILNKKLEMIYISEKLVFEGKLFIKPFFNYTSLAEINGIQHTGKFQVGAIVKNQTWILMCSINEQNNIAVLIDGFNEFLKSIITRYEDYVFYNHPMPNLYQQVLDEKDNICVSPISTRDKYSSFLKRIQEANKKYRQKRFYSFYKCLGKQNVFEYTHRPCYFENLCYDSQLHEFQYYQPSSEPIFYDRVQGPIYEFTEPFINLGSTNFTPKVAVGDLDINNTMFSDIKTVLWDHSDKFTIESLVYEQLASTFITLERRNSKDPSYIKYIEAFGKAISARPILGMDDYINQIRKEKRFLCFKHLIVSSPSKVFTEYADVYKEGREVIWERFKTKLYDSLGIIPTEPSKNILFIRNANITNCYETVLEMKKRFPDYNFTFIDVTNYSIQEQLELVSKFSIVVGSELVPFMHNQSYAIIPDTTLIDYEEYFLLI